MHFWKLISGQNDKVDVRTLKGEWGSLNLIIVCLLNQVHDSIASQLGPFDWLLLICKGFVILTVGLAWLS